MNFPSDAEIREYSAYYIRAIKIFRETFKFTMGREPSESELEDFSRMGIIPFGILKQQNGSSNFQTAQISPQKLVQQAQKMAQSSQQKPDINEVNEIIKNYPQLSIEGNKIVMKDKIEPADVFYSVMHKLESKGWKYVSQKHTGGSKWEPGYFEFKDKGAKA